MSGEIQSEYTDTQIKVATGFYVVFIIALIVTITGAIWVIVDFLLGETKITEWLYTLNFGLVIVIIGGLLAGLFFIIVFFYGLSRKGRKKILKWTFKAKEVDETYKNRKEITVIAFLFLISIIIMIIGGVIFVIMLALTAFTQLDPSTTLAAFSNSQLCLFIGIAIMILDGLGIFMINFIKNGYYFVLKLMGRLEKESK